MPNPTPIDQPELHELIWNGDLGGAFYMRGHVPLDVFLAAVQKLTGECPCLDGEDVPSHTWARLIPRESEDYGLEFKLYREPARGAFPVTFMEHTI